MCVLYVLYCCNRYYIAGAVNARCLAGQLYNLLSLLKWRRLVGNWCPRYQLSCDVIVHRYVDGEWRE